MKFNKAKHQVLPLGHANSQYLYGLGDEWIESSTAEKDFRVLVDEKLDMSWPCVPAAQKAKHALDGIQSSKAFRAREGILTLNPSLVRHTWSAAFSCGVPRTRKAWSKSRGGKKIHQGVGTSLL